MWSIMIVNESQLLINRPTSLLNLNYLIMNIFGRITLYPLLSKPFYVGKHVKNLVEVIHNLLYLVCLCILSYYLFVLNGDHGRY